MWLLALACTLSGPEDRGAADRAQRDRAQHAAALAALDAGASGAETAALCAQIQGVELRVDCAWAAAEATGEPAVCALLQIPDAAPGDAEALLAGADECYFLLAESTGDAQWCGSAGRFEMDCRMHHFSRELARWMPPDARPGWFEAAALSEIAAAGLAADEMAAWSAAYRRALSGAPLDRGACDAVADPARREACQATAVAVFHDRLNRARDRKGADRAALCEGPLPPSASYLPDPALDAALAERRAADLCDPDAARTPPPPGGLPGG